MANNQSNNNFTIATLGSHSALQILKGAKDEGFSTLVISTPYRLPFYKRFRFIDEFVEVKTFSEFPSVEKKLLNRNIILIPHGSFVAYLGEAGNKNLHIPYFGNKKVLDWEGNRKMQLEWLKKANLNIPRKFGRGDAIDRPVIVKSYGAAGGKGYFIAYNQKDFKKKVASFLKKEFIVQEYVIGVPIYLHFFYSPLNHEIELMSIDRMYETNIDSFGRLPLVHQENIEITP